MTTEDWQDGHRCRHCGYPPEPDGGHTCPCPYTDDDCPDHPAFPTTTTTDSDASDNQPFGPAGGAS